jgi:hypothetical protein
MRGMREIKFRAWDEEKKQMSAPFILGMPAVFKNGVLTSELATKRYGIKVMQYTGLKDKNGKEIYEGDILEYKRFLSDGNERGFVEYNEYAEWSVNNWLLNRIYRRAEVIGNRFANPELLEEGEERV